MSKTYRFVRANGVTNIFADITAPDSTIGVQSQRSLVTRNGVQAPLVRTSFVKASPISLTEPGCTDNCAPRGLFTRLVRIETSHAGSSADVITALEEALAVVKANPSFLEGFNFPPSTDIVVSDLA